MTGEKFADQLALLMRDIGADTAAHVRAKIAAAVEPLEKRLAALESRPAALKYQGVWRAEVQYAAGDTVTHSGSMWCAMVATQQRPGETRDWQLCVKGMR